MGDRLLAQALTEPKIRSWIGPFTEHRRPTFPEGQVAPLVATQSGTPPPPRLLASSRDARLRAAVLFPGSSFGELALDTFLPRLGARHD